MSEIGKLLKLSGSSHHAFLVEGDREESLREIRESLEKNLDFTVRGNPDFFLRSVSAFLVGDARATAEFASGSAFGPIKVCAISFDTANSEAQNALLKVLEDPKSATIFFVLTGTAEILLPTLRSRLMPAGRSGTGAAKERVREFLAMAPAERIKLAAKMAEEASETKDKSPAMNLLRGIEEFLRGSGDGAPPEVMHEVIKCERYLRGSSPSVKLILEHISLIVPKI